MRKKEQKSKPTEFEIRFRDLYKTFKNESKTTSEYVYDVRGDLLEIRPGESLNYPYTVEKYIVEKEK